MKDKTEVIKHSAAIQIQNGVTLLQRRAWNILLAYAYDALLTQETHEVRVQDVMRTLAFNSHNEAYLKEALKALVSCAVEWNVLDKDGSEIWGVASLLASAEIQHGLCTYSYAPPLRKRLYNPRMYARLCLALQNKFTSKHALALWELCVDYLGSDRDYGETPFISLPDYRRLLGRGANDYERFNNLNFYCIKQPVAEINRVADFRVAVAYKRHRRQVTAIKFTIQRALVLRLGKHQQGTRCPDLDDMPSVVRELQEAGLSVSEAWSIFQQGFSCVEEKVRPAGTGEEREMAFTEYVREKIHLLTRRQAAGKVESATGFLLAALRQNYSNPEYAAAKQQEASRVQQQAAAAVERHRQELAQQQAAVEARRDQELQTLYGRMVEEQPAVLEQAVTWALQDVPGFHLLYHREHTAQDNYRGRVTIQALLNPSLERQAPERFVEVRERYAADLAAMESQRRALQP